MHGYAQDAEGEQEEPDEGVGDRELAGARGQQRTKRMHHSRNVNIGETSSG